MDAKNFSYILLSKDDKFCEITVKELKDRIKDDANPLILYNRLYKKETGPLTEEESNNILKELERD